jgi:hypothetical protein
MAWIRTVSEDAEGTASQLKVHGAQGGPAEFAANADSRQELVVATDSRLRAGYAWDAAPKILRLSRGDSVLAFAGATDFAYPMLIQAANAVDSWGPSRQRRQALAELKGHLVRVFNGMLAEISDLPRFEESVDPQAMFLLAGFCWKEQRFRIWTLHYDPALHAFTFRPASPWRGHAGRGKVLAIVGDEIGDAKGRLVQLLRDRRKLTVGGFDLEPLEVLTSMIQEPKHTSIGGPVQVVKVYRSLNSAAFVVPADDDTPTLLGRRLLPYEIADQHPVLRRRS